MEVIKGYTLTKEEIEACLELVQKMRAEREKEIAYNLHLQQFEDLTMSSIDAIGLEQTKQIVRLINRQLRGVGTD